MAKRIKYKIWHHKTPTREHKQNILWYLLCLFISSVMSHSLWSHGLQHTSPPFPRICTDPCPLSHDAIQPPHYLSSASRLTFNLFQIRVLFNESDIRIKCPKYWSFSFSITPFNGYSGLISFRIDWLDLLAVQGTLKGLLQHHNSKASILRCSAFFMVQPSGRL